MLAQIEPTRNDFPALARYLVHGKHGTRPSPDRVAWMVTRNMMEMETPDPELAARIMTLTAAQNPRVQKPTYHASLSAAAGEHLTPEQWQQLAGRVLELTGLGEHEALIVGHGDARHAHVHLMVNRVHPETGNAWKTSHDYARFDKALKQLADDYKFRHTPCHRFDPEGTDTLPAKPDSPATWAAKRGARTDRPQWARAQSRAFGEELSDQLDQASTWEDVEAAVANQGLRLEAKGQGLIVGDDESYTKFSALGLTTSAKGFARKFGETFAAYRARRPLVDAIDIAKAVGTREEVRRTVNEAVEARKARTAKAPAAMQLQTEIGRAIKASTSLGAPGQGRSSADTLPMKRISPGNFGPDKGR